MCVYRILLEGFLLLRSWLDIPVIEGCDCLTPPTPSHQESHFIMLLLGSMPTDALMGPHSTKCYFSRPPTSNYLRSNFIKLSSSSIHSNVFSGKEAPKEERLLKQDVDEQETRQKKGGRAVEGRCIQTRSVINSNALLGKGAPQEEELLKEDVNQQGARQKGGRAIEERCRRTRIWTKGYKWISH